MGLKTPSRVRIPPTPPTRLPQAAWLDNKDKAPYPGALCFPGRLLRASRRAAAAARCLPPCSSSVVRWQLVAQASEGLWRAVLGQLLPQAGQLGQQRVDMPLLAHDHRIELVDRVFSEAGLDFQVDDALLEGVHGRWQVGKGEGWRGRHLRW